ncbi:MAG TPA: DUF2087 domain-containing protein [Synergistales bacterium]|nr:DUF2087 domain-containing protein [Synergistales bacterium]
MKGRARHAKVFLAMMQILDQKAKPEARLLDLSANSRMADEQYALTRGKYEKITRKYFREDGTLLPFTLKARERVALPRKIVEPFGQGVRYSKKELNTLLAKIAEDYVLVRRCLVDHGFVSCRADGSTYWVELKGLQHGSVPRSYLGAEPSCIKLSSNRISATHLAAFPATTGHLSS